MYLRAGEVYECVINHHDNTVAIEVPGGNRIRRINIKAQHSAFSRAINRTVSYGLYRFIESDVSS